MAKAYVATRFTDKDGTHEVGKEIELPRTTPEEKANFERLLDYGIISETPVGGGDK